jgi:tetrahydromethanopterin:alpha-L-glutamate ligase
VSPEPRIAVITEEPGWHGAELRRALEARDTEVRFVRLGDCRIELAGDEPGVVIPGFEDRRPDGVLVRDVPGGTLEQVVLRLDVLHALRELGVPVYNDARAIERTVDKGMTSFLLRRAGVDTPPTWVTESREQARAFVAAENSNGYDVVLKPLFGSLGAGLRRLSAGVELPDASQCQGVWYLQRLVDTGRGTSGWHDWRVLVVGGSAIAAMIRRGADWVSNVAQGAHCELASLEPALTRVAVTAADAVGADYAGVDLVRDVQGRWQVLEVNGIPAWRGLQGVSPVDIAGRVADDFLSRRVLNISGARA